MPMRNEYSHHRPSPHHCRPHILHVTTDISDNQSGEVRLGNEPSQEMVKHCAEQVHVAGRTVTFEIQCYPDVPPALYDLPYEPVASLDLEIPYPFDTPFIPLRCRMIATVRNTEEPQCGAEATCREQPEVDELHTEQPPEPVISQGIEQGLGCRQAIRERSKIERLFRIFMNIPDSKPFRQPSVGAQELYGN